jgi:hypothetical protein
MKTYTSKYGEISGIGSFETYPDGMLKECTVHNKIHLETKYGLLTPQYEYDSVRKKYINSISFYKAGSLSRISLNEQTEVTTSVGAIPAELITFYENGNIKRLFPLNGHLSAYWEEKDEYELAEEYSFNFPFGSFKAKIIAISFYESGEVKDLTLWPKETISILTPLGMQRLRIGFSLYPNGSIKSFEPFLPVEVKTTAGIIKAFDVNASGISGDKNSINFYESGELKSLITSTTKVVVTAFSKGTTCEYSPEYNSNDSLETFKTLKVEFENNKIRFNDNDEYDIDKYDFITEKVNFSEPRQCSDCSD